MRTSFAFLLLAFAAGCSSSSSGSTPTTDKKTDGGVSSTTPATTSSSLLGTWDIALVANGDQGSSVLTLTDKSLSIVVDGSTLTANIGGDFVAGSGDGESARIHTTHTITALDTGIFPYALGGAWTFKDDSQGCTSNVADGAISIACAGDVSNSALQENLLTSTGDGFYGAGTTTFKRTSTLTSKFGALGGAWTMTGPSYTCQVKFEGSAFDTKCSANGSTVSASVISITFADTIASGKINSGELSAKKR